MTANQDYFDAAVRHQVGIRRLTTTETRRVLGLLEEADRDLVRKLRERLSRLGSVTDFTSKRYKALLTDIREARVAAMTSLKETLSGDLLELAKKEIKIEQGLIQKAVPVELEFASVNVGTLREVVYRRPFQGRLLGDWYKSLEVADRRALTDALQLGLAQGESIPQLVARVAGTRAKNFTDGALAMTRRNAEAVVRTAVNHVSNAARERMWEENSDVVAGLRWTATLDGRTSAHCRALDGKVVMFGDRPLPEGMSALEPAGMRPPAHVNCRSVMVAILDGVGILGTRPTVRDTRTRGEREIDFRAQAREEGVPIQEVRRKWADENVGSTPAETTYQDWLMRQPAEFQDDVLGKGKAELFRTGKMKLDEFVDRRGAELTLAELEAA